jgi:nucleoside-diphosphate-sugar epimerase
LNKVIPAALVLDYLDDVKIELSQMMKNNKTALVVGANGVIGSKLIAYLEEADDWDIVGLSRRGGQNTSKTKYIAVDLLDEEACKKKLQALTEITHIFYAAYQDRPTWAELVEPNLNMLINVVNSIERVATNLEHVSLMQGYKVYGAHYGPFKTPAKETDGGHMPPEFNVDQQEYLEKQQAGKKWTWSALRPSVVGGSALGNPMNLVLVIALYASISKEFSLPLRFPGKPGAYDKLLDLTDAGLLAKATVWAATNKQCANQAFNVTNGDLIRWNELWPKIANYFDMDVAPPLHMPLQSIMSDKGAVWDRMQQKYNLEKHSYESVSSWGFGDFVFSWDYDFFSEGTKARRLGFHEYVETEKMFFDLFDELKKQKVIPDFKKAVK